jgi:hypothetical protein
MILPQEECVLLRTLSGPALRSRVSALHSSGWSLQAIANAWDPPKQRSTIRTWTGAPPSHTPPIPSPSSSASSSTLVAAEKSRSAHSAAESARRARREFDPASPVLDATTKREIRRLAPLARRYRARANPDGIYARSNDALTLIVKEQFARGATVRELATAAGVTYRAMARRIGVSK